MVVQFLMNIGEDFLAVVRMQLSLHPLERHSDDISMVKFGAEVIAELQPHLMNEIDIFRPKPWRMRSEIYKDGRTARRDDFQ